MKIGDKVKFIGCDKSQINWGGNDDPNDKLIKGNFYIISFIEVHTWHTKISIEGITGKFNSVCFEKIK